MPTSNNISRREFLKNSLLIVSTSALIESCNETKRHRGAMVEDSSQQGHLLRKGVSPRPTSTINIPVLIVGAGISGLSAAYHFQKELFTDYLLLEMGNSIGGNSIAGKNDVSAFPWAAHYLPIVNNTNTELLDFLHEHNVVTGYDANGLPVYNEYYLCFDPEERLFINDHWQEGLIPHFGVNEAELKEISRFFNLVAEYKNKIGKDGKPAFEIPVHHSSNDSEIRNLDKITFNRFLIDNNFTSPHLLWYLNYSCKDDYGSTLEDTSAYAGLHYFCARRARASNAESSAVLTWPEGNSFLANKLIEHSKKNIRSNQLTCSVSIVNNSVEVIALNTLTKECTKYICDRVILSTPQYVNNYILSESLKTEKMSPNALEYSPWLVANITLLDLPEHKGEPLSWDNVIYNSESLGYVNACHQHLDAHKKELVLTYYLPFTENPGKEMRKKLRERSYESFTSQIIADLGKAHKDIEKFITNIDIKLWGHGMVKPKPGTVFSDEKSQPSTNIKNKIFFAHSDLSGISIFEEAFYQGTKAAKEITQHHDSSTKA